MKERIFTLVLVLATTISLVGITRAQDAETNYTEKLCQLAEIIRDGDPEEIVDAFVEIAEYVAETQEPDGEWFFEIYVDREPSTYEIDEFPAEEIVAAIEAGQNVQMGIRDSGYSLPRNSGWTHQFIQVNLGADYQFYLQVSELFLTEVELLDDQWVIWYEGYAPFKMRWDNDDGWKFEAIELCPEPDPEPETTEVPF